MSDFVAILRSAVLAIALALVAGLFINVRLTMPDDAPVYLDRANRTYFPAPCLAQWKARPTSDPATIDPANAVEAYETGYTPDAACRQAGLHASDSRNLTTTALEYIGVFPKHRYWWDDIQIAP